MDDPKLTDILDTTEAAAILGVSEVRVKQLITTDRLPAKQRNDGRYTLHRKTVERFAAIPRHGGRPKSA